MIIRSGASPPAIRKLRKGSEVFRFLLKETESMVESARGVRTAPFGLLQNVMRVLGITMNTQNMIGWVHATKVAENDPNWEVSSKFRVGQH